MQAKRKILGAAVASSLLLALSAGSAMAGGAGSGCAWGGYKATESIIDDDPRASELPVLVKKKTTEQQSQEEKI